MVRPANRANRLSPVPQCERTRWSCAIEDGTQVGDTRLPNLAQRPYT